MNEHLICVGFGKCGTTLLNFLFRQSPRFVTPRETKEILYFDKAEPKYDEYLGCFNKPERPENLRRVFFEASPPYVSGRNSKQIESTFRKINATVPGSKILICLRHPAYRAYSHYVHNLHAFSVWGNHRHLKPANHPEPLLRAPCIEGFEEANSSMPNLQTSYFEVLRLALDIFGSKRVRLFFLEKDVSLFGSFFSGLCKEFKLDVGDYWRERPVPRVFSTDTIPAYIYCDGRNNADIATSKGTLRLSPGDLLAVSNRDCFIVENITEEKGRFFTEIAKTWTSKVSAEEFRDIFDKYYRKDVEKTLELMQLYRMDTDFFASYLNQDYKPKELKAISLLADQFKLPYRIQLSNIQL